MRVSRAMGHIYPVPQYCMVVQDRGLEEGDAPEPGIKLELNLGWEATREQRAGP